MLIIPGFSHPPLTHSLTDFLILALFIASKGKKRKL